MVAWLKCEFMLEKVGERFSGEVSSIAAFGVFVKLSDYDIEGLIHVTDLAGDFYHFDPVTLTLMGEKTGELYQIGDPMIIQVKQVSLDDRKIDFEAIEHKMTGRKNAFVTTKQRRKSAKTKKAVRQKKDDSRRKRRKGKADLKFKRTERNRKRS